MRRIFNKAFSLVEVVLSLGIVSVSMLVLIGLLSAAGGTKEKSNHETFAAQVVANEFERLKSFDSKNFPDEFPVRYYNSDFVALGDADSREAVYSLTITETPPVSGLANSRILNAEFRYPVRQPQARQNVMRFCAVIPR